MLVDILPALLFFCDIGEMVRDDAGELLELLVENLGDRIERFLYFGCSV